MIRRNYLALDVGPAHLRAVALHRRGKGSSLAGGRTISLPEGVLSLSVRKPNILDRRRFIEAVQEVLDPLAGREERLALSLPDTIGRLLLAETETAFKTRQEGIEILKWQLKGSLPGDPKELLLDFQVLEKRDTGRYRLVVAVVDRNLLQQYEELVNEAGYHATVIDFHSLHVYNYYRPRLELGEDFILVGVEGGVLSLQFFQGQILTFHRAREVAQSPLRLFQELSRSVVSCQEQHAGFRRCAVFVHSDWSDQEPLLEAVRSAFEREEVTLLEPHLERLAATSLPSTNETRALVAAVGAAERLMLR